MNRLGKKILIVGSGGSGKSTLAVQLGETLSLPVIHLDKEYWNVGWVATPKEEWLDKQKIFLSGDFWIADGNYSGSLELRLTIADTVIFLDFSRFTCLCGIIKRRLQNIGKTRPDMAEGCPEKIDLPMLRWVWTFPSKSRPKLTEIISKYKDVELITFKRRREIKNFLKNYESYKGAESK